MSRSERSRRRSRKNDAQASDTPRDVEHSGRADSGVAGRFEIRCACGSVLRGERIPGEDTVICPGCGSELFLPRAAGELRSSPARASREMPDGDRGNDSDTAGNASAVAPPVDERQSPRRESAEPPAIHPDRLEQRKQWNWLRLGALAAVLLVAGTSYWGWQQRQRQQDLFELQTTLSEGEQALDRGEFQQAVDQLGRADRAAKRLGSFSSSGKAATQGRRARQLFREAVIWSKLSPTALDAFFFHAPAGNAKFAEQIAASFASSLAGRSLVFQARATPLNNEVPANDAAGAAPPAAPQEGDAPAAPVVALDWAIVTETLRVEVAAADLGGLNPAADGDVLFGAELKSLERDPRRPNRWLVRLVPESVVLLTMAGPLVERNWPELASAQMLLDRQREMLLPAVSDDARPAARNAQ